MPDLHEPSSTMQAVCAARVDSNVADPIAIDILQHLPEARTFRDELDKFSRGMFTRTILVRSAFFAKALDDYDSSCAQLVVLCSGLDFRFLNHPGWKGKPTFLIDHPGSLELTREYTKNHQELLSHTRMIPVDLVSFSQEGIEEQLTAAGFDSTLPTLFLWEGASYYFKPEVVDNIIKVSSAICDNCTIVADFANEGSFMQKKSLSASSSNEEKTGVEQAMDLLKKKKEPWYGFFTPAHVQGHLNAVGYNAVKVHRDAELEIDTFGDCQMVPDSMFYVTASK